MKLANALCGVVVLAGFGVSAFSASDVNLDPQSLGAPPVATWPTFNGDYTGQRFSTLTQINPSNVNQLAAQWVYKITDVGAQRGAPVPVLKCTPILVDGVLYITIPDHVWALDARSGKELWHYAWVDHGGHLVGQRGAAFGRQTSTSLLPTTG